MTAFRLLPTGVIVAIASGALAASAQTQGDPPGAAQAEQRPVMTYGDENPSCLQWTDDCFICARGADGAVACSTAGVVCVAAFVRCTKSVK
jgi:hypothetical protein